MTQNSKFFEVSEHVSNGYSAATDESLTILEGLPPECLNETKLPQDKWEAPLS